MMRMRRANQPFQSKTKKQISIKRNAVNDPRKLKSGELNLAAREILRTATQYKNLVEIVKKIRYYLIVNITSPNNKKIEYLYNNHSK